MPAIKPSEVAKQKSKFIPETVFSVVNDLIAKNYTSGRAQITQDEIIADICALENCDRSFVFEKGWLNFEEVYEAEGWKVEYDKPGYNETYGAYFVFKG